MEARQAQRISLFPRYQQLIADYDPNECAVWCRMKPAPRPCFTPTLLREARDVQKRVVEIVHDAERFGKTPIHYVISASAIPGIFSLGGDLAKFKELILTRNRKGLHEYAYACIELLYQNAVNLQSPVTTISLVQGDALGGGFEGALSASVLVAERSAKMGFPEVLFNLLPGMGAYSFLGRRVDLATTERIITSGKSYTGEELYEMGIVDKLADDGQGVQEVHNYIHQHRHKRNSSRLLQQMRHRFHALDYE